jgi:hypothetical protein
VCFGLTKEISRLKFSDSFAYVATEKFLADAVRTNGTRTCTETGFSVVRKRGPSVTRDKTTEQGERVQGNRTIAPTEKLACHSWQCGKCSVTRCIHSSVNRWRINPASPTTKSNTELYVTCGLGSKERDTYVLACATFICVRFMHLWNWTHKMWKAGKWPVPYDYGICRRETSALGSLF